MLSNSTWAATAWVTFPNYERCSWLNATLTAAWPSANLAVSDLVSTILRKVFKNLHVPAVSELTLRKFTLGTTAPKLGGVNVSKCGDSQVVLDIQFKWGGNPDVQLVVKPLGTLPGFPGIPIRLAQLQVFGTVRVVLDFGPNMPIIGAVSVSTLGKPKADFTLQVLGGDVMNLPGLTSTVDNIINNVLAGLMAWPKRIFVPLQPGVGVPATKIQGMLYCRLVSASDLPQMDFDFWNKRGRADPYVVMSVRPDRPVNSVVKPRTLAPRWDEMHQFMVYDPGSEELTMTVWDEDIGKNDEKIGTVVLPLSRLEPNRCHVFEMQPLDMTGLSHALRKEVLAVPPTLHFEVMYIPYDAVDVTVPAHWTIPPSGILTVRLKRAVKLPAKRLARLKKAPFAVLKVGNTAHRYGPSTKLGESGVEWANQEVLTFIGIDPEAGAYTRPLFGSTVHSLA